ncbi:MAG: nitrogen fixation sigma-54 dependent transcriptional regulator GnfM [Thermodesulfovibrionales bacterium]
MQYMDRVVLILSGDKEVISVTEGALLPLGCRTIAKAGLAPFLRAVKGSELLLVDVSEAGTAALGEIKSYHPEAVVIAVADRQCEGDALEEGVYQCVEKPIYPPRLLAAARNAFRHMELRQELDRLRSVEFPELSASRNPSMLKVLRRLEKAAESERHALITGEKGTGKELLARAIHYRGPRRARPFVTLKASDPGFEEALFAGALSAEGGTVFVERVDELDAGSRERLATALGARGVSGNGDAPLRADVRVVCSARKLQREDPLYQRLGIRIRVPSLRERPEDIIPLAEHFISEADRLFKGGIKALTRDARGLLLRHSWPGNVGELKGAIKKAYLVSKGPEIDRSHLAFGEASLYCSVKEFLDDKLRSHISRMKKLGNSDLHDAVMSEVEKALIELVFDETGGNQIRSARLLGINRTTLRTKVKLYAIGNGTSGRAGKKAATSSRP